MRRVNFIAFALCCGCMFGQPDSTWSQEGSGGPLAGMPGAEVPEPSPPVERNYELKHADGTVESGNYRLSHNYYLAPGWSKPRRMVAVAGNTNFSIRSGQSQDRGTLARDTAPGMSGVAPSLVGGLYVTAIVLPKEEGKSRSRVIVGRVQQQAFAMGGMSGMMGGSEGMAGGMGAGTAMGGYGGGMGMGSAMGGYGDEGGSAGMDLGSSPLVIVPLEEWKLPMKSSMGMNAQFTSSQLKNLALLVQVDCWIEEELESLRGFRRDAEKFTETESSLKELLSQEYQLQLDKQRADIDRLAEKLKGLQGELTRRAAAQERVVEVQLGQLVLEAQGLIGERP